MKLFLARAIALSVLLGGLLPATARGEAMLQYFNTDWNEIAAKMPELAEAGYTSLWVPPPTKGSGGLSVGYDLFDRFDLGSKDQRGSIRTRYGTEAELLRMIEIAHRFGIRVYLDNVMNHNAFDIPGFNASTPIDLYPGFVPEDFHLRLTQEGFYRKWPDLNTGSERSGSASPRTDRSIRFGLAVSVACDLYISDFDSHRVLFYPGLDRPPHTRLWAGGQLQHGRAEEWAA